MDREKKRAVVLVNLGTPEEPTAAGVRNFLRPFLSDPRVVEVPRLIWLPILYGIILPFRSPRVAKAYQSIWENGDSPLRSITHHQVSKLSTALVERYADQAPQVCYAMTYGEPSIPATIERLQREGVEEIQLLPLYPQYSATTTGAVYDQVAKLQLRSRDVPNVTVTKSYHTLPSYIRALADSVREHWAQCGRGETLLFSYHGIPRRNVDLGDPYYDQCRETTERVAAELGLSSDEYRMAFQSRLGRAEWLKPYTVDVVTELGEAKLKQVDVICPSFSVDCLETLEEMKEENREVFEEAGGGEFRVIPCLNESDPHIAMMVELVSHR